MKYLILIIQKLKFYKLNCRKRILNQFTIDNMVKNMEKEFTEIVENPNNEKIKNGKGLAKNKNILKELISSYFVVERNEYEWLAEEFNKENIHRLKNKTLQKKKA